MHPTRAYVLYNLLSGLAGSTMIAAYVPLLLSIGMSLSEVALLNVVFWTTIVILEIPTGMLADGRSRRFSVSCGVAAVALGFGLYSVVCGFWTAVAAECLVGIGNAFISGAISAWLTDALDYRGEKNKLRHTLATGSLVSSLAMVGSGFVCAFFLAPEYPRLCWALGALLSVGVFLCVRLAMTDEGEPVHRVSEFEACRESIRVLKRKRDLIWAASAATCMGLVIPFNLYWVPLVKERAGSSGVAWFWVPMYGAMALAGYAVRRSKVQAGRETGLIAAAVLATGIGLVFLWRFADFAPLLAFIVLHEFGRGLFAPLLDAYTQQHIEAHYRATYGSLQSFIGKIGYAIVLAAVSLCIWGKPTTGAVITIVLGAAGAGLVISAVLLWFFRPKGVSS
jgi:MFS family permease